jgi:hypothetical protein
MVVVMVWARTKTMKGMGKKKYQHTPNVFAKLLLAIQQFICTLSLTISPQCEYGHRKSASNFYSTSFAVVCTELTAPGFSAPPPLPNPICFTAFEGI